MQLRFCVIFLVLTLCLTEETSKYSERSSNDADELFAPTHEWQVVKKGQKIPKGLHVRINFETGLTEAKLLDENENEKTRAVAEVHEVNGVGAQNLNFKSVGNTKFPKADLRDALRNIKNDDVSEQEPVQNNKKFRSYDELKKDLSDLNLTPQTDAEILNKLVAKHKRIVKDRPNEISEILTILEDLEYLVHQYDNANEFVNLNGFKEVIFKNLNSSNIEIKREALKLFGSSVQNNAKVQIHALETGSIGVLLRIVALDAEYGVKNRAVFALSSLLRRFPLAQLQFIENAGLSVFADLLETKNIKIQLKIVTLVNDLILEHRHVSEEPKNHPEMLRQYNQVSLKQKLKEHNWCKNLNNLLLNIFHVDSNDHDALEKCLNAILSVLDTCEVTTKRNINDIVYKLQKLYKKVALVEHDDSEEFKYYTYLWNLCQQITEYSSREYKSEL